MNSYKIPELHSSYDPVNNNIRFYFERSKKERKQYGEIFIFDSPHIDLLKDVIPEGETYAHIIFFHPNGNPPYRRLERKGRGTVMLNAMIKSVIEKDIKKLTCSTGKKKMQKFLINNDFEYLEFKHFGSKYYLRNL